MAPPATNRQQRIRDLVGRGVVGSQEALREQLAAQGVEVAQATLSRDLRALGVVKGPAGYRLPDAARAGSAAPRTLGASAAAYLRSAQAAGHLAVLRTGPGQAQALAAELDAAGLDGLLGTVAGDDTIFVAARSATRARDLVNSLNDLAAGR